MAFERSTVATAATRTFIQLPVAVTMFRTHQAKGAMQSERSGGHATCYTMAHIVYTCYNKQETIYLCFVWGIFFFVEYKYRRASQRAVAVARFGVSCYAHRGTRARHGLSQPIQAAFLRHILMACRLQARHCRNPNQRARTHIAALLISLWAVRITLWKRLFAERFAVFSRALEWNRHRHTHARTHAPSHTSTSIHRDKSLH